MLNKDFPINISIVDKNMSIITGALRLFRNEHIFISAYDLLILVLIRINHNMILEIV
jgi:hypothetical protein